VSRQGVEWERLLVGASERVMKAVSRVASGPDRRRELGTGASGDRTLVADREAERVLVSSLSAVPGLRIVSEEAGEIGEGRSTTVAVVDPLDGSSNFSHGIPFYCTSVAVVEGIGLDQAKVGLVRNLVNGDVYYAERGRGARKNGVPIRTSDVISLKEAVASVDISRTSPEIVTSLVALLTEVRRQVHFGANALELCLLAEGRTDTFVDVRGTMRIVDLAAAYLIAREAGALVTLPDGGPLRVPLNLKERFSYVASANLRLHNQVMERLARGRLPGRGQHH
jgi:myo-inositol-1(or 4)-monophosphatase